jgi:hypothetical protein
MSRKVKRVLWIGLCTLAACTLIGMIGWPRAKSSFACEVYVRLPAAAEDPDTHRVFGKLSVNGQRMAEEPNRTRRFKVPLKADADSITIVYEFRPKIYTHIVRTKMIPVRDGTLVEIDLTSEDAEQPDRIEAAQVPTPLPVAERMCKLAGIGPDDVVFDIGCGDGRLVITAVAKFGAKRGIGIDIDSKLIEDCRVSATKAGLQDKIDFRVGDALTLESLDDATVVLLYVGEHLNIKLRPILKKCLKPGSRIVSHDFDMGDWQPDRTEKFVEKNVFGQQEEFRIHLWIIH